MGSISKIWSSSSSALLTPNKMLASKKKEKQQLIAMASIHNESRRFERRRSRRSLLHGGASVLPFVLIAAANATGEKQEVEKLGEQESGLENQGTSPRKPSQSEQVPLQVAHGNSLVPLLNTLGIIASGVLGALYATSQKEKAAVESTVESMNMKLSKKDAAATLLKENFERRLSEEHEERKKQVMRLEEVEASLSSQLSSANAIIAALGREMQTEKKLAEEFKSEVAQLESAIVQVREDQKTLESKLKEKMDSVDVLQDRVDQLMLEIREKEKNIETLNSLLTEKDSELMSLNSIIYQTRADLSEANYIAEELNKELLTTKEEVHSKDSSIGYLNEEIELLKVERDDINTNFLDLVKEYDDFKSSTEQKEALDSEQLSKIDEQLHVLKEKLEITISDNRNKQALISELVKERDGCIALLEKELNNIKKLKDERQATKGPLEASQVEVSFLYRNLEEAKSSSDVLSQELVSIREVLNRTEEELGLTASELKIVMEERESLKKELLEIYTKFEATVKELKEERTVVDLLKRDMEALGKQLVEDSDARRTLKKDLEGATSTLDEMNKSALLLSRELENANSRTAILEAEKEMILQSITEHTNITKEAKENIEDAQHLIARFGSVRESLEKRGKKLEEELALAKGKILRLRRQFSMREKSCENHHEEPNDVDAGTPTVKKTGGRRRKGSSSSEIL